MLRTIGRRLISMVFVLVGISFLTFVVGYLAPGDPVQALMGNRHDPALHARLLHFYGLDRPWWQQYGAYLWRAAHGDLGTSFQYPGVSVATIIGRGVPVSLELGGLALLCTLLIGIPVGFTAALRHDTVLDNGSMGLMLLLYAIPGFILAPAILAADVAACNAGGRWPCLPVYGWGTPAHLVLPLIVYAAGGVAYIARLTRASVLEMLGRDYIRTARAKGLAPLALNSRHVLRNALIPVVTYIGPSIAFLVTGVFVIEYIFNIPGIGYQTIQSLGQRDYPVVEGTTLLLAAAVVAMNLLTDLLYTVLDPRIRDER
jgi:ABC-type dipeptide/oligopeptide/nickel transport system permease component